MSDHVFRNPDKYEQRPERDFIRKYCPNGREGVVIEDLDLVIRWFGPRYGTDDDGRFRLVECKHGRAPLGTSKRRTFGLIDSLLSHSKRYDGFYVIRTDDPDWERCPVFTVNDVDLEFEEFVSWLNFGLVIEPMFRKQRAS